MNDSPSADPNLDEILASIRRIISEDGPAAAAATVQHGSGRIDDQTADDVLVLTRRAPAPSHPVAWLDDLAVAPVPGDVSTPAMDPYQAPPPEAPSPETHPALASDDPQEPEDEEVVVAPETEAVAAAAFEKLSAAAQKTEPPASVTLPAPGRTLEDVVRELMRPMIKEWLDENLASIVEARVDQEIDRIARRRVR